MAAKFFRWYFLLFPSKVFDLFLTYARHFWHVFAIGRHTRQLFVPWKRITSEQKVIGFSFQQFFDRLSYNLISRLVGAMVRSATIFLGLIIELINLFFWILVIVLWLGAVIALPLWFAFYVLVSMIQNVPIEKLKHDSLVVGHFLQKNSFALEVFERLGMSETQSRALLEIFAQYVVLSSSNNLSSYSKDSVTIALLADGANQPKVIEFLYGVGISSDDFLEVVSWVKEMRSARNIARKFWLRENLQKTTSFGKDWSFGYTPLLDAHGIDLAKTAPQDLVFNPRFEELEQIETIFSKRIRTNIVLVGEPGVGKKGLCYFLAKKIWNGETTPALSDHRVVELDIDGLLAETNSYEKQVALVEETILEASRAGNIIIVIDDIDRYVMSGKNAIDLSRVFENLTNNDHVKLLALTTKRGYQQVITANKRLFSAVEIVQLEETTPDQTMRILQNMVPNIEKFRGVKITHFALKEIVTKGSLVVQNSPFPEAAINILETAITSLGDGTLVNAAVVDSVISKQAGVTVGRLQDQDKENLASLADRLHQRVIGQDPAVRAVAQAIQQSAVQLRSGDKTVGALLFLGPTGVGKTELAKSIAAVYYDSPRALIRIDCAEYSQPSSLANLIGSAQGIEGHSQGGQLTEAVRQHPASVVLFDEIEKADQSIIMALMTIFDEGYLTDARGDRISFRHAMVIATSNAGSLFIRDQLAKGVEYSLLQQEVLNELIVTRVFPPEFLNRFDATIVFEPLSLEQIKEILVLKLSSLQTKVSQEHGIFLELSESTMNDVISTGYSPEFGARNLDRVLSQLVTQRITDALISGSISRGQTLVV